MYVMYVNEFYRVFFRGENFYIAYTVLPINYTRAENDRNINGSIYVKLLRFCVF